MLIVGATAGLFSTGAWADGQSSTCPTLKMPLQTALQQAISTVKGTLGLGLNMWATVVAPDGHVCYVTYSSNDAIQGQWLASRAISAQKAFTANTLSLGPTSSSGSGTGLATGKLALSTANLYSAVQPEGSLFGLQESNPVFAPGAYGDTITPGQNGQASYTGPVNTKNYGTANDPMIGQVIGGINVFGGGLALYTSGGNKVGGVGVSGDTSCTDHLIAWNLRHNLGLDHLGTVNGVSQEPGLPDNIVFDITPNSYGIQASAKGWGHPSCGAGNGPATAAAQALPPVANP
jgi:uncharacterized protein GlcG (DUF336 family)